MSLYDVLQVVEGASSEEIRAAYLRLVQQHHPDRHVGEANQALRDRFKEIQRAYEVLYDPAQREAYDQQQSIPKPKSRGPANFNANGHPTQQATRHVHRPIDPSRRRDVPDDWLQRGVSSRRSRPALIAIFVLGLLTLALLVVPECSRELERYSSEVIRPYEERVALASMAKQNGQAKTPPRQPANKQESQSPPRPTLRLPSTSTDSEIAESTAETTTVVDSLENSSPSENGFAMDWGDSVLMAQSDPTSRSTSNNSFGTLLESAFGDAPHSSPTFDIDSMLDESPRVSADDWLTAAPDDIRLGEANFDVAYTLGVETNSNSAVEDLAVGLFKGQQRDTGHTSPAPPPHSFPPESQQGSNWSGVVQSAGFLTPHERNLGQNGLAQKSVDRVYKPQAASDSLQERLATPHSSSSVTTVGFHSSISHSPKPGLISIANSFESAPVSGAIHGTGVANVPSSFGSSHREAPGILGPPHEAAKLPDFRSANISSPPSNGFEDHQPSPLSMAIPQSNSFPAGHAGQTGGQLQGSTWHSAPPQTASPGYLLPAASPPLNQIPPY